MKYLCLIYLEESAMEALSQPEWNALLDECRACTEALQRGGSFLDGAMLQPVHTATTTRVRNGRLSTTDGPFAETKEQLGGFCLLQAPDFKEALRLAATMPPARYGSVEVRPVRALADSASGRMPGAALSDEETAMSGEETAMSENAFTLPPVVSRAEWLVARKALLEREKEATRERDAINAERRRLPLVAVDKDYVFSGPGGPLRLIDLFEGRRQLIIYHFMYLREQGEGCAGCSHFADNLPHLAHLNALGTTVALVSRAPSAEIEAFKRRMGWTMPWYSSFGSDFNYDFHATTDAAVAPVEYNYRDQAELERLGQTYHIQGEQPGLSVFLRDGERVYHSYSTYGRGLDLFMNTHNLLDMTPFGRGEGWDGMPDLGVELRHHDRYDQPAAAPCCGQ